MTFQCNVTNMKEFLFAVESCRDDICSNRVSSFVKEVKSV